MAIRRITDLPILESSIIADSDENLSNSYLEISYLTNSSNNTFESKAFRYGDLINYIQSSIKTDNVFLSSIYISGDMNLSGNMIVNQPNNTAGSYYASLNFGDIDMNAYQSSTHNGRISLSANSITIGTKNGAQLKLSNNTISAGTYATIEKTNGNNGKSIVNCDFLSAELQAWKSRIISELTASQTITYNINFPILSFIYSDHKITDMDQWVEAGSTINLNEYEVLYQWLTANNNANYNNLRKKPNMPDEDDTWYYTYDSTANTLTLPYTNWFIQGTKNNDSSTGDFISAGLPNITGQFCHGRLGDAKMWMEVKDSAFKLTSQPCSGDDSSDKEYRVCMFNASWSNPIYGNSKTVQPISNKMFIYFYVGPKKQINF